MSRTGRAVTSLIDPSNPLISELGRIFGGYLPGRRSPIKGLRKEPVSGFNRKGHGGGPRTDLVSEKLCDDIVQYLAPTLEPYKGCTIIDVHPGACVWSRKLHDALQPKCHLLMEPEELYVDSIIKPLLEKPGSTYKHTTLSGAHPKAYFANYQTAIDQGLLPPLPKASPEDPAGRQLDTSILVTGNLARIYADRKLSQTASFADIILQQMTWAALRNDLFHRQGRVRMLWWLPEWQKEGLIPQKGGRTNAHSAGIFMGANISEVVGVNPANTFINSIEKKALEAHPALRARSADNVQQKMKNAAMSIPEGRESLYPYPEVAKDVPGKKEDFVSPVAIQYETVEEFEEAFQECETRVKDVLKLLEDSIHIKGPTRAQKLFKPFYDSLKYPQSVPLTRAIGFFRPGRGSPAEAQERVLSRNKGLDTVAQSRIVFVIDCHLRIINIEAHFKSLEEQELFTPSKRKSYEEKIIALDKNFRAEVEENYRALFRYVEQVIYEQLACFADPPIVPFDKRAYEPLKASTSDFWPLHDLALLDLVPTDRDLSVPDLADLHEVQKTGQEIIKSLYLRRGHSLPGVLEMIAPNASKDLLPMCPSVSDPRKGGRMNSDALKVRMLSTDMLEELIKAWFEWPFRPQSWELALATGGSSEALGGGRKIALTGEAVTEGEEASLA